MNHDHHGPGNPTSGFWRSRYAIGLLAFAAIALYFLFGEHRAHALGAVPYLLLLACPLLHFFMHRGHGRPSRDEGPTDQAAAVPAPDKSGHATHHHG